MKKYLVYIGLLVVGLFFGWLLFGSSSNIETVHNHEAVTEINQMWTCSMHPQIMQPEAGDCPICGMDLIPAESSSEGLLPDQFKLSKNAMALANIQTTIVGTGLLDMDFMLSGKIIENENETATMPAHFNGRIEKLYVNSLGEKVQKGQAIAQIYAPELIAAQQELIVAYKLKNSQPELYNAVRNKFKNWMIQGAQLDEVEQTGKVKASFTIYSHVAGIVTEILINEGSHIMEGKPIFKVSNLKTVWANFDVYENQIHFFKKAQEVSITTNAYSNKEFKGKVAFIDPILNSKTRTVNVRVVLNNKKELFKPGMFVTATIRGLKNNSEKVLTIPTSAVLWTGERSVVYLKTNPDEPVFEMREIKLGNQIGTKYEVLEGIFVGNEIVTNGTFTVDAAAQLQGKKSMMNKNGDHATTGHEGHFGIDNNLSSIQNKHTNKNERIKVSKEFQNQLKVVFNDYVQLKDALVENDLKDVTKASKMLLDNLAKVDMKLLTTNSAHTQWMSLENEIKAAANIISNTSNIKEQRNHFKKLSSQLTNTLELFGIHEKVYLQFCPMADNNKGAYWLSKEEKVSNPYFGGAMLTCGEVKQIIIE